MVHPWKAPVAWTSRTCLLDCIPWLSDGVGRRARKTNCAFTQRLTASGTQGGLIHGPNWTLGSRAGLLLFPALVDGSCCQHRGVCAMLLERGLCEAWITGVQTRILE